MNSTTTSSVSFKQTKITSLLQNSSHPYVFQLHLYQLAASPVILQIHDLRRLQGQLLRQTRPHWVPRPHAAEMEPKSLSSDCQDLAAVFVRHDVVHYSMCMFIYDYTCSMPLLCLSIQSACLQLQSASDSSLSDWVRSSDTTSGKPEPAPVLVSGEPPQVHQIKALWSFLCHSGLPTMETNEKYGERKGKNNCLGVQIRLKVTSQGSETCKGRSASLDRPSTPARGEMDRSPWKGQTLEHRTQIRTLR